MTYTAAPSCPDLFSAGLAGDVEATGFAPSQSFTACVSDGLTGVTRVVMMLHSRRYRVTRLNVEMPDGAATRVSGTVSLPEAETGLLMARLMRMPAVVSAEAV